MAHERTSTARARRWMSVRYPSNLLKLYYKLGLHGNPELRPSLLVGLPAIASSRKVSRFASPMFAGKETGRLRVDKVDVTADVNATRVYPNLNRFGDL